MERAVRELETVCGELALALVGLSMDVETDNHHFAAACQAYDRLLQVAEKLRTRLPVET